MNPRTTASIFPRNCAATVPLLLLAGCWWNPFSPAPLPDVGNFEVTCDRSYEVTNAALRATFEAKGFRAGKGVGPDLIYQWNFRDGTDNDNVVTEKSTIDHVFP